MTFKSTPLSPEMKNLLISTGGWEANCPVGLDRLNLLEIDHINFHGEKSTGEMIVLDVVSESVLNIFKELFEKKFPIHSIKLLHEMNYDDEISMEQNNSSCFNNRPIAGTNRYSIHSYGLAIDINPLQNPCIIFSEDNSQQIFPKAGRNHLDRSNLQKGMVEPIVDIFKNNGFSIWGGNWKTPIDYHHFQTPWELAHKVENLSYEEGKEVWKKNIKP